MVEDISKRDLNEEVVFEANGNVFVSGGGCVVLQMRGEDKTGNFIWKSAPKHTREDWKEAVEKLYFFEVEHKVRLNYDGKKLILKSLSEAEK